MTTYRICLVGDGGVGKTAVSIQFIQGHFVDEYDPTIECGYRKQISVDGEVCLMDIYETPGSEEYTAMRDLYYRNTEGFIFVYSITNRASLMNLDHLFFEIESARECDFPLVLIGNKCDLVAEREVETHEGRTMANRFGCPFFETSARTAENVGEAFHECVRAIRNHNLSVRTAGALKKKEKRKGKARVIPSIILPIVEADRKGYFLESDFSYIRWNGYWRPLADLYFTSDRVLKYQYLLYFGPVLCLCPNDVMNLILYYLVETNYFSRLDYFSYPVHRSIVFTNCSGLMDRVRQGVRHYYVPGDCGSIMVHVLEWMYTQDSESLRSRIEGHEVQCKKLAFRLGLQHQLVHVFNPREASHASSQLPSRTPLSFAILFNSPAFSDFTFETGDRQILMHEIVLVARGGAALLDSLKNNPPKGSSYEACCEYFKFLYSGELTGNLSLELVKEVYDLVMHFEPKSLELSNLLVCRMMNLIDYSNCVSLLMWSRSNCGLYSKRMNRYIASWMGYRVKIMESTPQWLMLGEEERAAVTATKKEGNWIEGKQASENCCVS
jgi:GTPase KRas protein